MRYKYFNPIIRGFNPDPSVCRVGSDYYIVTSTFEYFPAIPIYHSVDLVNWEHIANAVTRPTQLPMAEAYASGGVWAPTIRYSDGVFYITATFSGRGNFIISAADPRGEWSDAVWTDMDGIDPSMLFDGGKMYYCANDCGSRGDLYETEGISLAEMNPKTGKVIGEIRRIWEGTGGGWLEAPHIYHIGDWYYLLAAEGGTGENHTAVLARSRDIWGEYEPCPYNPILTNRNDTTKQISCAGHADLVESPSGDRYMVHLAARPYVSGKTTLGRETFLTPVKRINDWFIAENNRARIENKSCAEQRISKGFACDFTVAEWEMPWLFVRGRDDDYIKRGNGTLTLRPNAKLTDKRGLPSMAAVRQPDFECAAETELEFTPHEDGDETGLCVYLSPDNIYSVAKKRENGADYITVTARADDFVTEIYSATAPEGRLRFKIISDTEKYGFYYALGGCEYITAGTVSAKFITTDVAEHCFTGAVIGVYAQAETNTTAAAKITRFAVE